MVKDGNYITICGWMVNDLKLKGSELVTYALIFGFCQDGETEYTGSIRYISEWFGWSTRTTIRILNSLVQKGYLLKTVKVLENNTKMTTYKVSQNVIGSDKLSPGVCQSVTKGTDKMSHNNNKYITKDIKSKNKFNNFNQRNNDYSALQKEMIKKSMGAKDGS